MDQGWVTPPQVEYWVEYWVEYQVEYWIIGKFLSANVMFLSIKTKNKIDSSQITPPTVS